MADEEEGEVHGLTGEREDSGDVTSTDSVTACVHTKVNKFEAKMDFQQVSQIVFTAHIKTASVINKLICGQVCDSEAYLLSV